MPYARITQGKSGRLTKDKGSNGIEGLAVCPVKGHAVIILEGKKNGTPSISLIHYSKFTQTHTLNRERLSFDKNETLSVYVYFNHLKSNPHLIDVLRVRLQESGIEHELREFPEKEKGLIVTFDEIKIFNPKEEKAKYEFVSHDEQDKIDNVYIINEAFKLLQGFLKASRLDDDGKIQHVPCAKMVKYDGDIYRHLAELADYISEPIDVQPVVFENDFNELCDHDTKLSPFAQEIVDEIPKQSYDSTAPLVKELKKIFGKRSSHMVATLGAANCNFDARLEEVSSFLLNSSVLC